MSHPTILVTGATGKTGTPVVEQLLELGYPVRALARVRDARSARLEELGAEVVTGDFLDLEAMRAAVDGVDRVYFCYPPQGGALVEATTIISTAAKEANVTAIVNMSQISAHDDSSSPLARQHWLSENILDWAGVGAIHVRPTFFAEMLVILAGETVARDGKIYLPYGDERHAPVAASDIARVIVGALTNPGPLVGERLIVTGDKNRSLGEMADLIGAEIGKPVEYVDIPNEMWGQALRSIPQLNETVITHLRAVANEHKKGVFRGETDVVARVGGRPPIALDAFIRSHRSMFGAYEQAPNSSQPGELR
jgi:NAD(P)H dehydrogenase (quinone)